MSLEKDERSAHVEWMIPEGTNTSLELEQGTHRISYRLKDGTDCQFIAHVKGRGSIIIGECQLVILINIIVCLLYVYEVSVAVVKCSGDFMALPRFTLVSVVHLFLLTKCLNVHV